MDKLVSEQDLTSTWNNFKYQPRENFTGIIYVMQSKLAYPRGGFFKRMCLLQNQQESTQCMCLNLDVLKVHVSVRTWSHPHTCCLRCAEFAYTWSHNRESKKALYKQRPEDKSLCLILTSRSLHYIYGSRLSRWLVCLFPNSKTTRKYTIFPLMANLSILFPS